MLVKVTKRFYDLHTETLRLPGDEFTVSKERFEDLSSASFVVLVKEYVEEKRAKRTRKKASE